MLHPGSAGIHTPNTSTEAGPAGRGGTRAGAGADNGCGDQGDKYAAHAATVG